MVEAMQEKFMKYWKLSFLTICIPVILDPRYKFKFLEFCLKSGLESEATRYLAKVKRTFILDTRRMIQEWMMRDKPEAEADKGHPRIDLNLKWDMPLSHYCI